MTTFAVIVPVYNGEKFINGCVMSILNQTRIPDEVIFVDDGSSDKSAELLSMWSRSNKLIRTHSILKQGVSEARNFGANQARSENLMFLDVDDRWHPEKIAMHERHLFEHEQCKFSFTLSEIINYSDSKALKIDKKQTKKSTLFNILMHEFQILGSSSSVCLQRKLFVSSGGFDPNLKRGEDWELWVRCAELSQPCEIDKVLVSISLRDDSVEQTRLKGFENFYSTELHLRIWSKYVGELNDSEFSKLATRILFADLLKNRFTLISNYRKYRNLFVNQASNLLPYLKFENNRFLMIRIIWRYLRNWRKYD